MKLEKAMFVLASCTAFAGPALAQTTPAAAAGAPAAGTEPGTTYSRPYDHPRGMGPGMMGGGMMGGGMMGGGMMGGMMGQGMMMDRALSSLDLSDAQRSQVLKIQDDVRHQNWDLTGKTQDEMAKLRDAYLAGSTQNRQAILDTYKRIDELRLHRIENVLDAQQKIESVLTAQQRDQLKRVGPWWAQDLGQ
jgi:Spy/CpxP family protein refolding chaperone